MVALGSGQGTQEELMNSGAGGSHGTSPPAPSLSLSLPRAHSSCTSVAELKIVVFVKLLLSPIHYREGDAAWGNYSGSAMAGCIIEGTIARVMGAFFLVFFFISFL